MSTGRICRPSSSSMNGTRRSTRSSISSRGMLRSAGRQRLVLIFFFVFHSFIFHFSFHSFFIFHIFIFHFLFHFFFIFHFFINFASERIHFASFLIFFLLNCIIGTHCLFYCFFGSPCIYLSIYLSIYVQVKFHGEELKIYGERMTVLQKAYNELLVLSNKRVSDLHSLHDFMAVS